MNSSYKLLLIFSILFFVRCSKEKGEVLSPQAFTQAFKTDHSKGARIKFIIDEYTKKGVPGTVVAIKDSEGVWEGTSGFAKIESGLPLPAGFVYPAASITKLYMATAFLKMNEEGLVKLDSPIIRYLPRKVADRIEKAKEITVRMLLNHSSGLRDYISDPDFKFYRFNYLSQRWTTEKALTFALKHPLLFKPGTGFAYSNTNYLILSLLMEHTAGMPEGQWLEKHILKPSGLNHTFYKWQADYINGLAMPDFYLDRFGDGRLENVTAAARSEIESELGDGGLVATSIDLVRFMDELMNEQIISPESLSEMKQFGPESEYGLGLETGYNYSDEVQYGHQGSVYGGFSMLLYFEKQKISLFVSINADATLVGGKTLLLCHEMKNEIAAYLSGS